MKVAGGKEEGSPGKGFPPGRLLSKAKPVARHLFPPAATEPRHDVAKETQSLVPAELGPKGRTCREMVSNVEKCLGSPSKASHKHQESLCVSLPCVSRKCRRGSSCAFDPGFTSRTIKKNETIAGPGVILASGVASRAVLRYAF